MTTRDANGGGLAARRAVARWAVRLFRRDWRQQSLLIAMLTAAVAVAVFGISAAYNVIPSRDGEFGTANHRFQVSSHEVTSASELHAALEPWLGPVEVIGHGEVRLQGDASPLALRQQDTSGPFSAPMLRLVNGRYPNAPSEVAITDGAGERLGAGVGSVAALDSHQLTIVGTVENPAKLDDEFVLLPASDDAPIDSYTVLVSASAEQVAAVPASVPIGTNERRPACHATLICVSAGQSEQATAAAAALGLATLLLGLVALVAVAGFVVVAQRRLRQLGMFLVNGATDRHIRLVMLTNGALVGLIAAVAGIVIGVSCWLIVAPRLEHAAGHRIDRSHLPLWMIVGALVLAVLTSVGASSKPARTVSRVSIIAALAARPPNAAPARRSAGLAVALIVGGVIALSQAIDIGADRLNPLLLIGGIVAVIIGVVFLSPSVLAALGRVATHAPIAQRIALRDLSRYRARSATALAAISLALALPVAVTVVASAAKHGGGEGNLSDRQIIVRIGDDRLFVPQRDPAQLERLQATVDKLASQLRSQSTILRVAVDPNDTTARGTETLHRAVILGRRVGEHTSKDIAVLYVATRPLVDLLGLPAATVDADVDVLTPHVGVLTFANSSARDQPSTSPIEGPHYSSFPTSLITDASLQRHGWVTEQAGWLLQSDRPITTAERRAIRDQAGAVGLTAELRDQQGGLGTIRNAATAGGLLLTLAIVALALGLLHAETTNDLRTLTATGATSTFRRSLSAATGGALGAAGALLGTVAAGGALAAAYSSDLSNLRRLPLLHLGLILVGLPAIGAIGSWLFAGREPPTLARAPLE